MKADDGPVPDQLAAAAGAEGGPGLRGESTKVTTTPRVGEILTLCVTGCEMIMLVIGHGRHGDEPNVTSLLNLESGKRHHWRNLATGWRIGEWHRVDRWT